MSGSGVGEMSEGDETGPGTPWTAEENRLVVADYFAMMADELAGRPYNKAATLRALAPLLNGRSRGSIEFKRANISAALDELGFRHLTGYLPRGNFQASLQDAVEEELQRTGLLGPLVESSESGTSETAGPVRLVEEFALPPTPLVREGTREAEPARFTPRLTNFSERDSNNRALGAEGEEWTLAFERRRLARAERPDLAGRIEWTSHDRGDGFGYDIKSFEPDGSEILIEVKTTRMGKRWPFIVTRNELNVSRLERDRYRIYRVFLFGRDTSVYRLPGAIDETCVLEARSYTAQVG